MAVFFFRVGGVLSNSTLQSLRADLGRGWSVGIAGSGTYSVTYNGTKGEAVAPQFEATLHRLSTAFREDGIPAPDICPFCKKGNCDALARIESMGFLPVHRACLQEKADAFAAQAEKTSNSHITGILSAFLGALVGVIPSILVSVLLRRVFGLTYALVPICAFQGYRLFRGTMSKRTPLAAAAVFSALAVILMEFGFCAWHMAELSEMVPTIGQLIGVYFRDYGVMELVKSMFFWGLGVWMAWGQVSRTASYASRSADDSLDTMTHLDGTVL